MPQAPKKAPPAPDPFESIRQTYFDADPVHEAYESGWVCEECGAPVKADWPKCPSCDAVKMLKLDDPARKPFKFSEAKAKRNPPKPVDTVTVTEIPADQAIKATETKEA